MNDKFLKSSIYTIIASLLVIFLLIQPYNIYCRISKSCKPVIISSIFWHKTGQEKLTIYFSATIPKDLKNIIEFYPEENFKEVTNGKNIISNYQMKNLTNKEISIRSTYSITPPNANKYLDRIECLCFQMQTLGPKESIKMPINFIINSAIEKDPKLKKLKTINVNYKAKLILIPETK